MSINISFPDFYNEEDIVYVVIAKQLLIDEFSLSDEVASNYLNRYLQEFNRKVDLDAFYHYSPYVIAAKIYALYQMQISENDVADWLLEHNYMSTPGEIQFKIDNLIKLNS